MLAHHLLLAVLAAPDATVDWTGLLPGIPFLAVLALLWRVATWHSETDGRLKSVEVILLGDGKGNEGCASRHRALDKIIASAPDRGSMDRAFDKVRQIEDRAAEDRLQFTNSLTKMQGSIDALTGRIDRVLEERRETTNPRGRIPTER